MSFKYNDILRNQLLFYSRSSNGAGIKIHEIADNDCEI